MSNKMKKLQLTMIALLVMVGAQAQITEKDLLGEWNAFIIETSGITVNLKTEEVTFTDEMKQMIEESGEDIEAVKPMVSNDMKAGQFSKMKLVFKQGLKAEWTFDEDAKEFGYTIAEENGVTYLARADGGKMQVSFKDGVLNLMPNDSVTVGFEKKK
jgi:uncharacterized protein YxeA